MTKTLYFFRHGETDYQRDPLGRRLVTPFDAPLGQQGIQETTELANYLRDSFITFGAFYTSPATKARQTTKIIMNTLPMQTPIVLDDLRDLELFEPDKKWINRPREEWESALQLHQALPDIATQERLRKALETIMNSPTTENIGIVTHGNPARILLFMLDHPQEHIPDLQELKGLYPINRSEGWKLVLNQEGQVLFKERISLKEDALQRERESTNMSREK